MLEVEIKVGRFKVHFSGRIFKIIHGLDVRENKESKESRVIPKFLA